MKKVKVAKRLKRSTKLVWTERFEKLRAVGLDGTQMEAVFSMLSEGRVFRYAWLEDSAREQFDKVMRNG